MAIKVGINGFGRIGRNIMRAALGSKDIDYVAVNDLTNAATRRICKPTPSSATSRQHHRRRGQDHGRRRHLPVLSVKDPLSCHGRTSGRRRVRVHGLFTDRDNAAKHLAAGAKKVIITAPAKKLDFSVVLGVNEEKYDPKTHHIISNASCTTNCLAPIAKVLHENLRPQKGLDDDDPLVQRPATARSAAQDLRRRAAPVDHSTTTGAATAVGEVPPELKGSWTAFRCACRPERLVRDLAALLGRQTTGEEVNAAFKTAADGPLKGLMEVVDVPLVSIDFRGNPHSSIVDAPYTKVMDGDFVKVLAWYDNEWGYSSRCVDLLRLLVKKGV
jgi:glyceraldehyde 3-phosphate dehydrogenase